MKHTLKISIVLITMFLIAQFAGLYVINSYATQKVVNGEVVNQTGKILPYGMGFNSNDQNLETGSVIFSFLFSLLIMIGLILVLIKFKARFIMRFWFFIVSVIGIGISFTAFLPEIKYAPIIALVFAIPLVFGKVYKRSMIAHNFTELLIYPGIAAIFAQVLNLHGVLILLGIISIYDLWAVWKSGLMMKMANFQMNELNILGGIMIPYASKKVRKKIKNMREKYKNKESFEKAIKKAKLKVQVAILGGGDIAYTILTAGVVLKVWGLTCALIVIAGALLGLSYLIFFGEKKKMYPAMPFITAGMFLAMIICGIFIV